MEPDNSLIKLMEDERKRWANSTKVYGALNVVARFFLIVASGIVAAEKTFGSDNSPAQFLVNWVPILAIAVTIVTALDAWMKPRDKWRGFMQDRDELDALIESARRIPSDNKNVVETLNKRFKRLRYLHREKNVF